MSSRGLESKYRIINKTLTTFINMKYSYCIGVVNVLWEEFQLATSLISSVDDCNMIEHEVGWGAATQIVGGAVM